jgi:hypothetical protein
MLPILLLVFLREGNRAFRYGLPAALPANMRGRFFAVIYRPLFRNADGGEGSAIRFLLGAWMT